LPLSGDNDYYLFGMSASNGDSENIGSVSIVFDNGFGYAYPFKVVAPPPISKPDPPSGPTSGLTNTSNTSTTGSSNFSLGDSVGYQSDLGDSTQSSWLSSTSVSHSWVDDGTYIMKARARKVLY